MFDDGRYKGKEMKVPHTGVERQKQHGRLILVSLPPTQGTRTIICIIPRRIIHGVIYMSDAPPSCALYDMNSCACGP